MKMENLKELPKAQLQIAITGQLKALQWYNKHIIKSKGSSNLHKIKNEYDKEKALEIKEYIWKRKWKMV